jgi:hypothetical protein
LAIDTDGMPKEPSSNDQSLPPLSLWDLYCEAFKPTSIGSIEAASAEAAIEAAAVEFDTDIRKLIAVRRREIA